MNRGRGRHQSSRGRSTPYASYVHRHSNVPAHASDASLAHESETSKPGGRKSDIASVDSVTKQFNNMPTSEYQYKPKSASQGVGNKSPNVVNSRLVQNVPKSEDRTPKQVDLHSAMVLELGDDLPSLSTCSKSSAKSILGSEGGRGDGQFDKSDGQQFNNMPTSVNQYKPKSASQGVGNISPNVGNSRLVQNVPKAEDQTPKQVDLQSVMDPDLGDDFPSLSTCSKSGTKSIRSIQSPCGDGENSSSSTISCRLLDDVTPIKKEPFLIGSSEVDIGSEGCRGNGESDKSDGQQKEHSYDICLKRTANVVKLKSPLFAKNREKRNEMKRRTEGENIKILRPGMILLKGYLPLTDQVKLIKLCRDLGLGSGGFYQPGYRDGAKLQLKMMCLGKNWDPETSKYGDERSTDGAKPPPIPDVFQHLVKGAIKDSHDFLDSNSKMKIAKTVLPPMSPNICIVNFYAKTGKLGLHKDKDESPESLHKGLPVVSFSIGDSAEFLYGDERDIEKAEKVMLESGDVLIFGGKSRHIFHGVSSIIPDTAPKALEEETNLRPGRLNLTFREY